MIFGNSNHPVEIKKINLRVWTLRDEIESAIAEAKKEGKELGPKDLVELYRPKVDLNAEPVAPGAAAGLELVEEAQETEETDKEEGAEETEEATPAEGEEAQADSEKSEESSKDDNPFSHITIHRPDLGQERIADGMTILADLNMEEVNFFSSREFTFGQSIVLEFLVTQPFSLSAEVVHCKNYNMKSRVISATRPAFRVRVKNLFLRSGERTLLRKFLQMVEPEIPKERPRPKIQEESDDDDEFDDLGL